METPEPVENARESFGDLEFDVDDSLSHVEFTEEVAEERENVVTGETEHTVFVEEGERAEFSYLDYYDGDWITNTGKYKQTARKIECDVYKGPPKPTDKYSRAELEHKGIVGIYKV